MEKNKTFWQYILLILVVMGLFCFLSSDKTLADPDSFYHAKMALLMRDQGLVTNFPWLQFATLKNLFVDHHFLYHIILIPFVSLFNPLIGMKISALIFATLAILIFYWFLRKYKIKYALIYIFLILTTSSFVFRLNLAKAPALSLIFLIIGTYLIFEKKYLWLGVLSFFYVWLYGAWPLILLLVFFYCLANSIMARPAELSDKIKNSSFALVASEDKQKSPSQIFGKNLGGQENINKKLQKYFGIFIFYVSYLARGLLTKSNLKLLFACMIGLLAGLIINPYFPHDFKFYWDQTVNIAMFNSGSQIGIGGEWMPFNGIDLLFGTILVLILWTFAFVWHFDHSEKRTVKHWFFWLVSIFFFLYTLKARRQIEYFIPFALLCAGFSLDDFWPNVQWKTYGEKIKSMFNGHLSSFSSLTFAYLLVCVLVFFYAYFSYGLGSVKKNFNNGFALTKFEKSSQWLKNNTSQGAIIFHASWDEFPLLFYYNEHNYYLSGLAPTFMYQYDQKLFWQLKNIANGDLPADFQLTGKNKEKTVENFDKNYNLAEIIKNNFHSSFILWDYHRFKKADEIFQTQSVLQKVYEDEEAKIYHIQF